MPLVVFFLLLFEIMVVSIIDIFKKKISNWWVLLNLFLFVLCLLIFPKSYVFSVSLLYYPFGWIVLGFILYKLKVMGAGDSKYLFSLFFIVPASSHEEFTVIVLIVTVILAAIQLVIRFSINLGENIRQVMVGDFSFFREVRGSKFSYAPVIFLSWLYLGYANWNLLK